ncbi:MAG: LysR family transcriptional regulator [Phenylobacterium sp.]|uniref:LysR family transcriptional regulator n=1 Tax=Phenylobacterium sp. TaxID=1871053 RepID=UPI0012235AD5|nr:LysR family transcriptional regulator [Phenylobacterium sp.]TAL36520.1 MAG: LysR family transcriptional regulator [Phenylobacterium sp.]
MEMQQVRYFLALARTLNFTRAAEQSNVSQPALTRAIQQLEHELGGPLFHRERANTHLSELGRMMLPYLEQIHAQTEAAKQQAKAIKKLDNVTLRIGAMCTIGPALISDLIVKFQIAHPNVDLEVVEEGSVELMDMLTKGDLNLALFGLPEPLDVRFHGLSLFQERFVIALPPDHPLAAHNVVRCSDTHEQPYVSRANCEIFDHARRQLRAHGVQWKKVFSSERDDWVQGMIKAGLGFGFFPELSVTDPGLVTRRLIDPEFVRTIMLVTVRGRPHSPAVGAFVQQARAFKWPSGALDPMPRDPEDCDLEPTG